MQGRFSGYSTMYPQKNNNAPASIGGGGEQLYQLPTSNEPVGFTRKRDGNRYNQTPSSSGQGYIFHNLAKFRQEPTRVSVNSKKTGKLSGSKTPKRKSGVGFISQDKEDKSEKRKNKSPRNESPRSTQRRSIKLTKEQNHCGDIKTEKEMDLVYMPDPIKEILPSELTENKWQENTNSMTEEESIRNLNSEGQSELDSGQEETRQFEQKVFQKRQSESKQLETRQSSSKPSQPRLFQTRLAEPRPSSPPRRTMDMGQDSRVKVEQLQRVFDYEKKELLRRIAHGERQQQEIYEKNVKFQQIQVRLQNQMQLLKVKNVQLDNQVQQGHQILLEKNGEIGKMQSYYEGILNQMQGKYNDLQKMLNTKTREAEALSRNCEEMTLKYQALASKQNMQSNLEVKFKEDIARLAALNQTNNKFIKENYEAKLAEKNKAQLEQQQSGTDSIVIARLAKELEDKDAQIHAAKDELAHLKEQVKGKAQLEISLESRAKEAQRLVTQLNRVSDLLSKESIAKNDLVQQFQVKLLAKDKTIRKLQTELKNAQEKYLQACVAADCKVSVFRSEPIVPQPGGQNSFGKMIQMQTEQTNRIREQISALNVQIFECKNENEALKNALRRTQQESNLMKMTMSSNISNLTEAKNKSEMVLRGQLESMKRQVSFLQRNINSLQAEIKQKDEFIRNHLLSQAKKEDAAGILQKLETLLSRKGK